MENTPVPVAKLSAREQQVLRLVRDGLSDLEIAGELMISVHTVRYYLGTIAAKLSTRRRTRIALEAERLGLI